jgi:hypothetical protein
MPKGGPGVGPVSQKERIEEVFLVGMAFHLPSPTEPSDTGHCVCVIAFSPPREKKKMRRKCV